MVELSVNEAIERIIELNGQGVNLYGALSLEFEGDCLSHIPRLENLGDYRSSIWASFDLKAIGQPKEWLN